MVYSIDKLLNEAKTNKKLRSRYCFHESLSDNPQQMVIVILKGSYIRPHKHPESKSEIYHLIRGEMQVDIFDESGTVKEKNILNQANPIIRIPPNTWHSPKSLSNYSVYHEIYPGSFSKDIDVKYAKWAKEEKC